MECSAIAETLNPKSQLRRLCAGSKGNSEPRIVETHSIDSNTSIFPMRG